MSLFGIAQRLYTIFTGSAKHWEILKARVPYFTLKPLSETRWECRVENVKAIRYQSSDVIDALLDVSHESNDAKIKSEAMSLANEMQNFEFIFVFGDMV